MDVLVEMWAVELVLTAYVLDDRRLSVDHVNVLVIAAANGVAQPAVHGLEGQAVDGVPAPARRSLAVAHLDVSIAAGQKIVGGRH